MANRVPQQMDGPRIFCNGEKMFIRNWDHTMILNAVSLIDYSSSLNLIPMSMIKSDIPKTEDEEMFGNHEDSVFHDIRIDLGIQAQGQSVSDKSMKWTDILAEGNSTDDMLNALYAKTKERK